MRNYERRNMTSTTEFDFDSWNIYLQYAIIKGKYSEKICPTILIAGDVLKEWQTWIGSDLLLKQKRSEKKILEQFNLLLLLKGYVVKCRVIPFYWDNDGWPHLSSTIIIITLTSRINKLYKNAERKTPRKILQKQ